MSNGALLSQESQLLVKSIFPISELGYYYLQEERYPPTQGDMRIAPAGKG